ncbi:MAG: hypothetical protein RIQ93_1604 [Verrucomicrobiota bacterium]|jgi:hypothetical protein
MVCQNALRPGQRLKIPEMGEVLAGPRFESGGNRFSR